MIWMIWIVDESSTVQLISQIQEAKSAGAERTRESNSSKCRKWLLIAANRSIFHKSQYLQRTILSIARCTMPSIASPAVPTVWHPVLMKRSRRMEIRKPADSPFLQHDVYCHTSVLPAPRLFWSWPAILILGSWTPCPLALDRISFYARSKKNIWFPVSPVDHSCKLFVGIEWQRSRKWWKAR